MEKNANKVFKNIVELVNSLFFQKYKPFFMKKVDCLIKIFSKTCFCKKISVNFNR